MTGRLSTVPAPGAARSTGPARSLLVAEYHGRVFVNLWRSYALSMVAAPVLYLLALGIGVGSLIDDDPAAVLDGVPYLDFVAPGLMASAAMQTAMAASLFPVLGSVKWMKTAYGMAATPIRPVDLAVGQQLWLAVQLLLGASVFLVVAAVAGTVHSPLALAAPLVSTLGGLAYSASACAWAISRENEWSFMPILRLGILPSFLLSGTFFPISQLPDPLQPLAGAMPLWHAVSLNRALLAGDVEPLRALGHVTVLVAYVAVGLGFGARTYRGRLHR